MRLYLSEGERYPHLWFETEQSLADDPLAAPENPPWTEVPDDLAQRLVHAWEEYQQAEAEVRAFVARGA